MEEDDKKEAAASEMNGTSATDHQEEDGVDRLPQLAVFNLLQIKEEPFQTDETETSSKKRKRVGGDAAMDSSPNLTPKKRKEGPSRTTSSETPTKRGRGRPPGSSSGSKKMNEGPSRTTSAETPTKRRPGRPVRTRGAKLTPHVIQLNPGQDVVEALYNISVVNHRKTVTILSASGSVSDIVDLIPNGPSRCKGDCEILLLSIKRLVDDYGRHCREKATCTVTWRDGNGIVFANTSVKSLIAASHVKIIAALFNTHTARILEFAQNDEQIPIPAIPTRMIKEEPSTSGFLPTTPTVGDGNIINPTSATTSASNDHDMKSPSVGDNSQDMKLSA